MAPKKGHLGFDTTATELQEKYTSAIENIMGVKGGWKDIAKEIRKLAESVTEALEKEKAETPDYAWVRFWLNQTTTILVMRLVAKLGVDIADMHKRVADCEKRINEIKTAL